jgi:hypothetical protein
MAVGQAGGNNPDARMRAGPCTFEQEYRKAACAFPWTAFIDVSRDSLAPISTPKVQHGRNEQY